MVIPDQDVFPTTAGDRLRDYEQRAALYQKTKGMSFGEAFVETVKACW